MTKNLIAELHILSPDRDQEACEVIKTTKDKVNSNQRKLYIESYGCQMNFSDSEIVTAIMEKENLGPPQTSVRQM